MARIEGWIIQWDDIAIAYRETVSRAALSVRSDAYLYLGHYVGDYKYAQGAPVIYWNPIGQLGVTAEARLDDAGVWVEVDVIETTYSRDAAELLRRGLLGGWSMDVLGARMSVGENGLNVMCEGLIDSAGLVPRPAYPMSWARVVE